MLEEGRRKGSAMNVDIAQRLYELRREHGYSQESLAEALDISRQAISKWERAESAPDMGNLIALADLYGMSMDQIVRPAQASPDEPGLESETSRTPQEDEVPQHPCDDPSKPIDKPASSGTPKPPTIDADSAESNSGSQNGRPEPPCDTKPSQDQKSVHAHGRDYAKPEKPARLKCGLRRFPYPLLVLVVVLLFAVVFGMWECVWLFLTIPFYYWVARIIERDPKYREAHGFPPEA